MGTEIHLDVASVSLSYAKNHMGLDYGFLFQPSDLASRQSDAIDYEYYEEHSDEAEDLLRSEEGFVRSLSRVLPRLRLLGSTIQSAEAEYQAVMADAISLAGVDDEGRERNLI